MDIMNVTMHRLEIVMEDPRDALNHRAERLIFGALRLLVYAETECKTMTEVREKLYGWAKDLYIQELMRMTSTGDTYQNQQFNDVLEVFLIARDFGYRIF